MTTEPMRPMTDDSSEVVVWVSIVRTSVTSLESRDTSSPTRLRAWKSSDSVTRRVEQLAAHLGDDPLPHHAQEVGLDEAAQRLGQEQDDEPDDQRVEGGGVPAGDDRRDEPRDDERHQQREPRPHDEPDQGEAERREVRPQVAEQAPPRHAAHDPDPASDLARRRRRSGGGLHVADHATGGGRARAPPGDAGSGSEPVAD